MQLEAQIGIATETIASTAPSEDAIDAKLNALLKKVSLGNHSPSNIYINSCHSKQSTPNTEHFSCKECSLCFHCCIDLDRHVKATHKSDSYSCNFCINEFQCERDLNQHIETNHEQQSLHCDVCGETFDSSSDLNIHTQNAHTQTNSEMNHGL